MGIDFTNLNALAAPTSPQNAPNSGGDKQPAQSGKVENRGVSDGLGQLQRQADKTQQELERARQVYAEHQKNIIAAGGLLSDIHKGADRGESCYNLLLKAAEAIGRMTGDSSYKRVLEKKLLDVRGYGLGDPEPLEHQRAATAERLGLLESNLEQQRGTDAEGGIKWAIRIHKDELQRIDKALQSSAK